MVLVQDAAGLLEVDKFHIIHDALTEVRFQASATFTVEAS